MQKLSSGIGLLALSLLAACGGDEEAETTTQPTTDVVDSSDADAMVATDTESPMDGSAPVIEDPTLTRLHDEVFVISCGGGSCHLGGEVGGGLALDNDGELLARLTEPSIGSLLPQVTPGSLEESYLWHKCEGTHRSDAVGGAGSRMPLGLPPLSPEQRALLEAWILAGAPE